jgi:hypothetical protein
MTVALRSLGRPALAAATFLAMVLSYAVVAVLGAPAAHAEECPYFNSEGQLVYCQTDPGEPGEPGEPGDPGTGGGEPTCDLAPPATFCMGSNACYMIEGKVPYRAPEGPRPSPEHTWMIRICNGENLAQSFDPIWVGPNDPQPPSLAEQAQTAFGQLDPGTGTLTVNPTTRSLVSLPTWFWADGLTGDALTGSSAFGLVAIATPDHLEVDPGDGTGVVQCPWTTTKSDTCSHEYSRSSATRGTAAVDGHDAYAATGEPVWSVAFELRGNPVNIPGAPTELRGAPMDAGVWVAESQAVVTSRG